MEWLKIEDFKFDKTGDVLLIKKQKDEYKIQEDELHYTILEKGNWYDDSIKTGKAVSIELNDNYIKLFEFENSFFKDVVAIMFMNDILNDYIKNN